MAVVLGTTAAGACVCYDTGHDGLCAIHREAGAALMPSACRNFPRVALRDPRGAFVTLSHFCPTAAGLLLSAGAIAIVEAPPSISLEGNVEGLDATAVMPPLLRPGMLMDLEGYSAWEREGIAVLDERRYGARLALSVIAMATRDAQGWRPGREALATRMSEAFARARSSHTGQEQASQPPLEHATKAFLASHLFASWAAYQRQGLGAVIDSLDLALSLVGDRHAGVESFITAVRAADLRLRHSADHVGPRSLPALRRH